ncbi:MAG: hypothetical protein CEO12_500 [Parcubacteria group bacterium Gr01-1014_46]|nr:MAG: hypothetical protein CEO12_500 [Parcubacteria group bacterium Gr01-1014_46]
MKNNKGLSLIEIIIVIGILSLIISLGLVVDLSFLKNDILKTESSTIVSNLEKARNLAMNNMFESPHGFCYRKPNYIIFRDGPGTRCVEGASTNQIVPANINISQNPNTTFPNVIIFSQLAGTTTPASIKLSDGIKSLDINVNSEGTIEW